MESPTIDTHGAKRKRTPSDDYPVLARSGGASEIKYLMKGKLEKLRLIEGDADSFGEILGMIDDYEGVLQRQESLAANLGAKLVGPLLLKTLDKLFDGPIKVAQTSFDLEQTPVTWLDVVTYARTNLTDFTMVDSPHGKVCRVWIKGGQVEISEDDYRLILSGMPERVIPVQPVAEDESAELGTLNILEARLGMLIKKADAVASKARQLNYHLKGRKSALVARRAEQPVLGPVATDTRPFSPQPFLAVNSRSPKPISGDAKLQQELLDQFMANDRVDRRGSLTHTPRPKAGRAPASDVVNNGEIDARRMSQPITSSDDGVEGHNRTLMAARIEKLARGDPINPPCDRCRRLKFECTKHLTACTSCTRKHAKCAWKDLKEGELDSDSAPGDGLKNGNGDAVLVVQSTERAEHRVQGVEPSEGVVGLFTYPGRGVEDFKEQLTQIASAASAAGNN